MTNSNKIAKKNAELKIHQRIYKKFWFVLPIVIILFIISIVTSWVFYFSKKSELNQLSDTKSTLMWKLNEYASMKWAITQYSWMKWSYNEYRQSLINFNLIFDTIEKYIPKGMERSSLKINKNQNNVSVAINGEVNWYNTYMSLLNVIDKCQFTDEKIRKWLLNISKVEIGWDKWDESLSSKISINYRFDFSTVKNKYLLQKNYDLAKQEFVTLWQYHYYSNVISWNNQDKWSNSFLNYSENIEKIVSSKEKFINDIATIKNTDINWYYLFETWENFISKLKKDNQLLDYYDKYLLDLKTNLEWYYKKINDDGIIDYISNQEKKKELENGTKEEDIKWKEVLNIKKNIENKIMEINDKRMEIYLLKRYQEYLLEENYLDTFDEIKKNPTRKYITIKNWDNVELSWDEYILNIIDNKILKETDTILNEFITFVEEDQKETEKNKIYAKYIDYVKKIDTTKDKILDTKNYTENFYNNYYKYNIYEEIDKIFTYYITTANYDNSLFEGIKYNFMNFEYQNDLFSFKNRYILTLKNNSKLVTDVKKIQTMNWFNQLMLKLEEFLNETNDIIRYNNNNIDCIVQDTKAETKNIYEWILDEKIQDSEEETKINELNIIIKSIE